ncbi:hypothetical protein V5799_022428 [Amblyomma americanum]|uniref:Uncharacterized protein n=1 Tax=Amblyomma americanum TaxID=6943 RepID=A0AAQ4FMK2_AMBAM
MAQQTALKSRMLTSVTPMSTTMAWTTRLVLDSRTLLCTYGIETNTTTVFPEDGICDLIFFDSAYKNNINVPLQEDTFGEGMNAVLAAASRYQSTEFGVAFSYLYIEWLTNDMRETKPTILDAFWRSGVFHFGIIDMPASNVSYDKIREVFTLLKMCQLKSKNNHLQFGIAVYDLEYDDYNNHCSDLNVYGKFSRLKMVRKVVEYLRSSSGSGGSCEDNVPCPSGASA